MDWIKVNEEHRARQLQHQRKDKYFEEWLNDGLREAKLSKKAETIIKTVARQSYKRGRDDRIA